MKRCAAVAGVLLLVLPAVAATLRDAIRADDLAQVKSLLDAGAAVNQTDDLGATPLHDAAWLGDEAIVRLLLEHGAGVNTKHTEGGSTPLLFAALRGHAAIVALLVTAGAEVNAANSGGATGLHFAARRGDLAIAALLLDHGANATPADRSGLTPLDEAVGQGSLELAELLLARGKYAPGELSGSLLRAVDRDNEPAARLLLKHGAAPNTPGVLHVAASRGYAGVVAALLEAGGDPNLSDADGIPALHEAALRGHEAAIRVLAKHGAKLDAPDPAVGSTPLYAAASMGKLEAVRALLELGADASLKAKSGRTAREAAAASGFSDIVKILP